MEAFLGQIMLFAGSFTPKGWLPCDGRALPIRENTAMFSSSERPTEGTESRHFICPI